MKKLRLFVFMLVLSLPLPAHSAVKSASADYKAIVAPILELAISQQGQSELKFGDIFPSSLGPTASPLKTIVVEVQSNTGERYQVSHRLAGPLENAVGDRIEFQNLKFRSSSAGRTGNPVTPWTPTADAAQTVFISDDAGTGETISIDYELTVPVSQAPGDYSSLLTYTVSSL